MKTVEKVCLAVIGLCELLNINSLPEPEETIHSEHVTQFTVQANRRVILPGDILPMCWRMEHIRGCSEGNQVQWLIAVRRREEEH